jgi:hypothetical protein
MMFGGLLVLLLAGCLFFAAAFFFVGILFHGKRATSRTLLVLAGLSLLPALLIIGIFWKGSISPDVRQWAGEYDIDCGGHLGLNLNMTCWLSAGDETWVGTWDIQEGDGEFLRLQFGDQQLIVVGMSEPFRAEVSHLPETIFGVSACNLQRRSTVH